MKAKGNHRRRRDGKSMRRISFGRILRSRIGRGEWLLLRLILKFVFPSTLPSPQYLPSSHLQTQFLSNPRNMLTYHHPGNQTLRSRTPNKIPRAPRPIHPNPRRLLPAQHALLELEDVGDCVCDWRNCEPESVFGHS